MDAKQIELAAKRAFELVNSISVKGEDAEKVTEIKGLLQGLGAVAIKSQQEKQGDNIPSFDGQVVEPVRPAPKVEDQNG